MNTILQWMIQSPTFRKCSTFVCGVACGLWLMSAHWQTVRKIREAVGCSRDEWMNALLTVIIATAGTSSVLLTVFNQRRLKKEKAKLVKKVEKAEAQQ